MIKYDIYTSTNNEEATAHGADYVYDGLNPADAVSRFISNENLGEITEVVAGDDEMNASAFLCDDGTWELHICIDDSDTVVTLPAVDYVSITEAAETLGLTRQRVHTLVSGGKLFGRMIGNAWVIARASVERRAAR